MGEGVGQDIRKLSVGGVCKWLTFLVLFCVRGNQEKKYDAGAFIGYSSWRPNSCSTDQDMSERDKKSNKELKAQATDYVASGVRSALGAVPFAGSLLSEIAGTIIPNQRIDRIADFAEKLEERIRDLEEDAVRSHLDDEEFTDLVEEGLRQAARATTEERRAYLASLIAKSLTEEAIEHSESRHLLRMLGELSDVEVVWLRAYDNPVPQEDEEFRERHKHILEPVAAHFGSSEEEIDKEALQKSYKAHLERLGLIAGKVKIDRDKNPEFDRQKGDFKRQLYRTTRLGHLLLRMIDCTADEAA